MSRRYQAGFITGNYFPLLIPSAPTSVVATAGVASVSVAFTAPTAIPNAPITLYTVTASNGATATGTVSPITVSGLTNGVSYTFTVTATNAYGTSDPSATSNAATPVLGTEVLIVAGGGGGAYKANARAGAGGAGGLLYYGSETPKTPNGPALGLSTGVTYAIVVGAGGVRSEPGVGDSQGTGSNSSFDTYVAYGGGGGGYNDSPAVGWPGGSGGGGFGGGGGGAGVSGQGNNGGPGLANVGAAYPSGGGGGAGAAGSQGTSGRGGNGGNGLQYSISGTATYYAGGGSGDVYFAFASPNPGTPGLGGGGTGYNNINVSQWGTSGAANTGGGGGSGSDANNGLGGSGVVIVKSAVPAVATTGSPQTSTSGGFYIYRYTSSGSIRF